MTIDLSKLNEPQRQAVLTVEGPLLVLAGAGSGKTSVLTSRIAHMVQDLNIAPWEILAITFTNKAANEMLSRVQLLIGDRAQGMWVSTFHKCCGKILRKNAELVGLTENYTICDPDDQKKLIKNIMKDFDIDEKFFKINAILNQISNAKNEIVDENDYANSAGSPLEKTVAIIYPEYQKRLKLQNSVDFDDMLLLVYNLFKSNKDVLEIYQNRFKYILVDEYQDTNHVQYELCKLLADKYKNIMVVGDDDQSIYTWRGADVRNILDFEKDYKDCKVIKLEQNYRSSANILNCANSVIANNKNRKAKKLFTDQGEGEKVGIYCAADERDEGRWIAGEIEKAVTSGEVSGYNECAVLYRANAQSRTLEDMFLRSGVPYRIVGGTKFFDRKEIRDVMAYLALLSNNADDVAFDRIINVPKRGIGQTSLNMINNKARELGCSKLVACESLIGSGEARSSLKSSLFQFVNIFRQCSNYEGDLKDLVDIVIDKTGIIDDLESQNTDEAKARIDNIKELLSVAEEFSENHVVQEVQFEAPNTQTDASEQPKLEEIDNSLEGFIEWVRLRTDLDAMSDSDQMVTMMTCHAAKGLEFDHVYVAGMEDGLFPSLNKKQSEEDMEEERRLAYVAITRARKKLVLCYAQSRRLYGATSFGIPSQFLSEIDSAYTKKLGVGSAGFFGTGWEKRGSRHGISGSGTAYSRSGVKNISSTSQSRKSTSPFRIGYQFGSGDKQEHSNSKAFAINDTIEHKIFGKGRIVAINGDKIKIKFASGQTKELLTDYAPIVKVVN